MLGSLFVSLPGILGCTLSDGKGLNHQLPVSVLPWPVLQIEENTSNQMGKG